MDTSSHPTVRHSAELRALSRESDPELRTEGLLSLAGREERSGHSATAAAIYQEILSDRETGSSTPILASVHRRAQTRLNALTGENAEFGARAEVLLREFTDQVSEPSMLFAMGMAGAAFRVTRFATLARLAANPSANIFTRGLGARALAGLAGFAVEAPAFTLAGRFGAQALGHSPNWSATALSRDLASSFLMLGALRTGGVLSSGLSRQIGRLGTAGNPLQAAHGPLQTLIQQTGMLAGILGGLRLEEVAGLRQARPGSNSLLEGLGLLLQFNVAGRVTRQAFGERFHQWENGMELRTESVAQANRSPRLPLFPEGGLGLEPALATAGPVRAPRAANEDLRMQQAFMIGGRGDKAEPSKIDETGLRVIRGVRDLPIPENGDMWAVIRRWVDQQNQPIIVGELVVSSDLAAVQVINRSFAEQLRWAEGDLRGQSVRKTFHSMSDSFIGSRVPLLAIKLLTSNWVEYAPTRMRLLLPDGTPVLAVGAGGIRKIQGRRVAFGIFTEIEGAEARAAASPSPSPAPVSDVRSVAPPAGRPDEAISIANAKAVSHFRNVQQALSSSNPPKDKK